MDEVAVRSVLDDVAVLVGRICGGEAEHSAEIEAEPAVHAVGVDQRRAVDEIESLPVVHAHIALEAEHACERSAARPGPAIKLDAALGGIGGEHRSGKVGLDADREEPARLEHAVAQSEVAHHIAVVKILILPQAVVHCRIGLAGGVD